MIHFINILMIRPYRRVSLNKNSFVRVDSISQRPILCRTTPTKKNSVQNVQDRGNNIYDHSCRHYAVGGITLKTVFEYRNHRLAVAEEDVPYYELDSIISSSYETILKGTN